jgi:prefoldin subunit 5
MDSQNAISSLQSFKNTLTGQRDGIQGQIDALDIAIKLLSDGYQSDSDRISAEVATTVAEQLPAQVAEQTATLQAQVADLTEQTTTLQAQVVVLTPDLVTTPVETPVTLTDTTANPADTNVTLDTTVTP